NPQIAIVHASSKNAGYFKDLKNMQYFCLVGNEGHRLESVLDNVADFNGKCVLPPYPRKMGTYVPKSVYNKTYELEKIDFTTKYIDAHTSLALQVANDIGARELFLVGYDGYASEEITRKELQLINEN